MSLQYFEQKNISYLFIKMNFYLFISRLCAKMSRVNKALMRTFKKLYLERQNKPQPGIDRATVGNDSSFWHQNFIFDNSQRELCSQGEFLLYDGTRGWNSGASIRFFLSPCKDGKNAPISLSDNHVLVVKVLDVGQPSIAEVVGDLWSISSTFYKHAAFRL